MANRRDPWEVQVNNLGGWSVSQTRLAAVCRSTLAFEGAQEGELSITLMDDTGILGLNREYFQIDRPTDVIAFALHSPGEAVLGDVYVGYDQAQRQAEELGIPFDEELLRLAVHGVLHVLGHRHPEGSDRFESEMYRRQEEILRGFLYAEEVGP